MKILGYTIEIKRGGSPALDKDLTERVEALEASYGQMAKAVARTERRAYRENPGPMPSGDSGPNGGKEVAPVPFPPTWRTGDPA